MIQFNCCSVRGSQEEVRRLLRVYQPHIVLLQETQLPPGASSLRFPGYDEVRQDRGERGGGLMTLFREGLCWSPVTGPQGQVAEEGDVRTEAQVFRIHPHLSEPFPLVHLYVPPGERWAEKVGAAESMPFGPSRLPTDACIMGDMNAHHPSWDPNYKTKLGCPRGRALHEWVRCAGAHVLNNGDSTRFGWAKGAQTASTAPDVTIVTPRFKEARWTVLPCSGSDHRPIMTDLPLRRGPIREQGVGGFRWTLKRADWVAFTATTEAAFAKNASAEHTAGAERLCASFTATVRHAAKLTIPRPAARMPGRESKSWWTKDVEVLVKARQEARRKAERTRTREDLNIWHRARDASARAIRHAKRESWREFASTLNVATDPTKIFNTIKAMDGRKPPTRTMAVLRDGERVLTDGRDKAELLISRYANVSRLATTDVAAERTLRREIEARLAHDEPSRRPPAMPPGMRTDADAMARPFSAGELRAGMRGLGRRKAAGPDGVVNEMLLHLGPKGRAALLALCNASWRDAVVPKSWRLAEIIPLLKKGKDPHAPKSYRPVALTSCIAKLLERLVRARLQHFLEKWDLLHHEQAGYRSCRSAEEQLGLTSQYISDAMQEGDHALMLPVDFEAAFDRARRMRLYKKLLDKKVPPHVVRWIRAFLTARKGRVRVGDMVSGLREFLEGFPQGTVLGPILWDCFVDDIVDAVRASAPAGAKLEIVIFADDVTLLLRSRTLKELYTNAQCALDGLSEWEGANDARVSLGKTSVTVFAPGTRAIPANQRPKLEYLDRSKEPTVWTPIQYEPTPRLLGVLYDERLSFAAHTTELREKVHKRANVMSALSGTKWGADRTTLRAAHLAYVQAKADYGLAAVGPFVAPGQLDGLGTEQYWSACKISGYPKGTRGPVALLEAGLQPIDQRVDAKAAVLYERCRRLPQGNRARHFLELPPPKPPAQSENNRATLQIRASKHNLRARARGVVDAAGLGQEVREPLATHSKVAPWADRGEVDFYPELSSGVTRRDTPEVCLKAAIASLERHGAADLEGFTDGSVLEPKLLLRGGGGYTLLDAARSEHRGMRAAGGRCNSYRAELTALLKILDDMIAGRDDAGAEISFPAPSAGKRCEIRLALDSQSAIRSLAKGPAAQTGVLEMTVWERLVRLCRARRAHVTIQYVPGHVDLEPQEAADGIAKEAAKVCDQGAAGISLSIVKAILRGKQQGQLRSQIPADHLWRRLAGDKKLHHEGLTRAEQCLLSQLRAGRCPLTADVRHRFGARIATLEVPRQGRHGLAASKLTVTAVEAGSPAAKAHIGVGSRIAKIAGKAVDTDRALQTALRANAGSTVKVHLNAHPSSDCPAGCGAVDGTEHLLCKCPAYAATRHAVFGEHSPPITVLQSAPRKVLRFLQRAGRINAKAAYVKEDDPPKAPVAAPAPPSANAAGTSSKTPRIEPSIPHPPNQANAVKAPTESIEPKPKPKRPSPPKSRHETTRRRDRGGRARRPPA